MNIDARALLRSWTSHGGATGGHSEAEWTHALVAALERARARWPSVALDTDAFVAALVASVGPDEPPAAIGKLHVDHLWLATACAHGDEHAAVVFVRHFRGDVEAALSRFADDRAFRADVADEVFDKLLVATPQRRARIAEYRGRSELGRWVRVTAVRSAVDRTRGRGRREQPARDQALLDGLDDVDDPELQLLKATHRVHFRAAFEHAVSSLPPRDRRLLRERIVHGLGVVQIADLHGTSKSTAARWVTAARQRLVEAAHAYLREALDVPPQQLHSLLRLATTGMHISVARILDTD